MSCQTRLFGLFFVVATAVAWFPLCTNNAVAQEPDPCGGKEICRDLLERGRQAYARGLYQEAGRYFNRAVNLSPAAISKVWYQIQDERHRAASGQTEATAPTILQPQSEKPSIGEPPAEAVTVIMGDDEGC
jgi:hypothetical protein